MLEIRGLDGGYGETQITHGLNLTVGRGEVHALLGRNGVGKTTTLMTIMGLLPPMAGQILFNGEDLTGKRPAEIAKKGLAFVPETRGIFGSLSVEENIKLAEGLAKDRPKLWTMERVFETFPQLALRRNNGGNELSGGEQQMLAIGRALVMNPELLILDEATEGLAPNIIELILTKMLELREKNQTILLVDQNFYFATELAHHITLMGRGTAVWEGTADGLRTNAEIREKWLGI